MEFDSATKINEQQQRRDTFLQVLTLEKQLLASIHTKGLMHKDVQEFYHQVRDGYESLVLNDHNVVELSEVEHLLWKLHYKHIDEFRRSIRPRPASGEVIKGEAPRVDAEACRNISRHIEAFKAFLSEAAEFYQNLIRKFREICGLPGELFIHKNRASPKPVEPMTLKKCQFTCHRLLICLGDIARHGELLKKRADSKWLVASTYYVEASRIWAASGNPHNQLALLATYVNDSFLALYYFTRSLAVEEPFPDAWNNLMVLFEESKSFRVTSVSSEEQLDFLKPYEKISLRLALPSSDGSSYKSNLESANGLSSPGSELWPLSVRFASFFLQKTSLEEFPGVISSIIKHIEALVQLDDVQLMAAFDSYKLIDSSRTGPFRALQLVSVFVFILHRLSSKPQGIKLNGDHQEQESSLIQLAFIATFICIARLVERCVQGNEREKCPLLPAVMVFVEWLEGTLDNLEAHATDEKVICAVSYFFSALSNLLNRLDISEAELVYDKSALWEDHELRGFEPLVRAHISLDFTTHWEWTENLHFKRSQRLFHSGMRIANQSNHGRTWISFDRKGMTFFTREHDEENHRKAIVEEKDSSGERPSEFCASSSPAPTEEEEVILFKPIVRHNSAPLDKYRKDEDHLLIRELQEPNKSTDEFLRQATSMFAGQNQPPSNLLSAPSGASSLRYSKQLKQQDAIRTCATGPPSLNAWVFDIENSNVELQPGLKNFNKHDLNPIQEVAVESLASLLIDDTKESGTDAACVTATQNSPPAYVAPVPSAPLLPDDAAWFRGNSSGFVDYNSATRSRAADGILGAAPTSLYPSVSASLLNFNPVLPQLVHGHPPVLGMSSSEWLYHYRNNHKLELANNRTWPVNLNGTGPPLIYHTDDVSRFDLIDQWGHPVGSASAFYVESPQLYVSPHIYCADERRTDNLLSYPRSSPFVCGAVIDTRSEQQPLLQYLKEKEWQLHSPQLRSPTFLGN